MADYKLPDVRQSWEEMSTVGSHEPGPIGSHTTLDIGKHLTDTEQGHTHKCTYYTEVYTKTHTSTHTDTTIYAHSQTGLDTNT